MIEEKVCFLDSEGVLQSYQSIYILNDKRFGSNCKIACCKVIHKGEVYSKEEFEDLGLVVSIESCEEQPLDETVTTLVDNGDNSFTYTNESGTPVTFTVEDEDTTYELQDNDDGTFDLVDSNGDVVSTIDACKLISDGCPEVVTTFVENPVGTYTYTSEDGTVTVLTVPTGEVTTTIVDNGDGTVTYTNEAGTPVIIDICKLVKDGGCIEPVAEDDEEETPFETPISGTVAVNDTLVHGDTGPLTYTLGTGPTNGTLVFNADGTYTYTPDDGFFGKDEFTYTVTNSESETDTATVCITILEPDAPTIVIKHITGGTSLPVAVNIDSTTECDTTPSNNIIGFTYYLNGFPVITVPPFINDGTNRPAFSGLDISSIGGTLNYDVNLLDFLTANGVNYTYLDQIKIVATIEDDCGLTNVSNDLIYTITDRPNAVGEVSQTAETGNSVDNIDASFVFTKSDGSPATTSDCFKITKTLKGVSGAADVVETFSGNVGDLIPTSCLENVGLTGGTQAWTGNILSLTGYSKNIPTVDGNGQLVPDLALSGEIDINIQIDENCSGLVNEEDAEANITILRGCWGDTLITQHTDAGFLTTAGCPRNAVFKAKRTGYGAQSSPFIRTEMLSSINGGAFDPTVLCAGASPDWFAVNPEGTGDRTFLFKSIAPMDFHYAQAGNVQLDQQIFAIQSGGTNSSWPVHLRMNLMYLDKNRLDILTASRAQVPGAVVRDVEIFINGVLVDTRPNINGGPTNENPYPNTTSIDIASLGLNQKDANYIVEIKGFMDYNGTTHALHLKDAYRLSHR